jgi:hypothetical protein
VRLDLLVLIIGAQLTLAQPGHVQIIGEASMATAAPAQENSRFALKAQFAPVLRTALAPTTQTGDRFDLSALLST